MNKLLCFGWCVLLSLSATAQQSTPELLFEKVRTKVMSVKDYTADVKMKIDVSFVRVPPMNGKLYYKSPDKMRLERNGGISILPKKDVSLSLGSLLPTGSTTVIDAGIESIGTVKARIIKVIPGDDNSGIILAKIWIDEAKLLPLKTETTMRENGTIKMEMEYGKYASWCLPDKITIHLDLKEYKIPKSLVMDYEETNDPAMMEKAKKEKNKKGKIQISYLNYKINTGLSDAVFAEKKK